MEERNPTAYFNAPDSSLVSQIGTEHPLIYKLTGYLR